jgi:outer membrane protein, multidrug efflux system
MKINQDLPQASRSASPLVAAFASSGPPRGQVDIGSGPAIDFRERVSGAGFYRVNATGRLGTYQHKTAQTSLIAMLLLATLGLGACSSMSTSPPELNAPDRWQAEPVQSGGVGSAQATRSSQWWRQFDDPLMPQLIDAAQAASPNLAQARARMEQARATRVASGAALAPSLGAQATATRGKTLGGPIGNSAQVGLQSSWELDLFGAGRAQRTSAQARLEGSQAEWHEVGVVVAAETASSLLALRVCEAQLNLTQADSQSRAETARLTGLSSKAGFVAPADAALARASAAQGRVLVTQQRAACDLVLKSLVALTAIDETTLRQRLKTRHAKLPKPGSLYINSVPAQVLAQRPDVFRAGRELVAAAADVNAAEADRYPRISLFGQIGRAQQSTGGFTQSGTVWNIGPVTVSLPLFDGGKRRANTRAARAQWDAAKIAYDARLRQAVREVEETLVLLRSSLDRDTDTLAAQEGFGLAFMATEARFKGGLASLFELEEARRRSVQAQGALLDLQREKVSHWISLYRALGGGWTDVAPHIRLHPKPKDNAQ